MNLFVLFKTDCFEGTRKYFTVKNMATWGGASITSDVIFDFPCSICARRDKSHEAEKYCVECEDYMCAACVDNHSSFHSMARHNLIERSNFEKSQTFVHRTVPSMPMERCPKHPTKLIDMYCEDHDSVHCLICITTDHGSCAKKHHIPEYVQKINKDKLQVPDGDIQAAIAKLNQTLHRQKQVRNDLENAKKKCDKDIEDFRGKINKLVDVSACEANAVYDSKKSSLEASTQATKNILCELEDINSASKMSVGNLVQQFVNAKTVKHLIRQTDELSRERTFDPTICFIENDNVTELLKESKSFGRVEVKMYRVRKSERYCVRQVDDYYNCDIWSCCLLDSGDILLADYNNKKVKKLDKETYTVSDSLKFPAAVHSICRVSNSQVAVTLDNFSVVFVNVDDKLTPVNTLQLDFNCRGIAVIGDTMYVSMHQGESVSEFSIEGKQRRATFYTQSKSYLSFFTPLQKYYIRDLCSSDDRKALYIAIKWKGLVTVDTKGNITWEFSGPKLLNAWGISTDGKENVFVGGFRSNNVVQLSNNGEYVGEVVPESFGLRKPQGLCFARDSNKLIVATDGSNEVDVFDLT